MLYTDTQEVGGACTDGRSPLLAQKLTALTQLRTHTANAFAHSGKHARRLNYMGKNGRDKGDSFNCVASSSLTCVRNK